MNRFGSSDRLNTAYDRFFCVENTPSAECGATCQYHRCSVVKAAVDLFAMRTDENITRYLCRPTVPFYSPFDNSGYKKRSVTVVYSRPEEDQSLGLLVREKPLDNDPAYTLVAGNKPFLIQSVSGTGKSTSQSPSAAGNNNLYPIETSRQNVINAFYKAAIPVAIIGPKANIPRLQQYDVPVENKVGSSSDLAKESEETSAGGRSKIMQEKERQKERQKEHWRKRQRERRKERYQNDPVYAEHQRERQRKRRKERCQNDPAYVKRERECQRKRYQNDHAFAERKRKKNRERYQNDSAYAQRQRIRSNAYNKIKRKLSKEEASKIASVARQQYFQLVNSPENSGDLPQTPNQAEVTPNSNDN